MESELYYKKISRRPGKVDRVKISFPTMISLLIVLLLASTSPARKKLLKTLKIPFKVVASSYEEDMDATENPRELAALLSFSAVKNNDPVGLILFSDQVEHFVPPKKGRGHVYRILRDLYYFKPRSDKTKISVGLEYLQGVLRKRATVFLFSDFMDTGYDRALRQIGRKHDLISCVIQDEAESEMPDIGLVDVRSLNVRTFT